MTDIEANGPAPGVVYWASTHACNRLRERIPNLHNANIHRLRRIIVALCHQGRRLSVDSWVIGQYYLGATEVHSGRELVLAMQALGDHPGESLVRTVLWADEFALWGRAA